MNRDVMKVGPPKPILVVDFDGVLHSYESGWCGADTVADGPVPGAQKFCSVAMEHFIVLVVSSRCSQEGGAIAILDWLEKYGFPPGMEVSCDGVKPPARVTLDDRALTFNGKWPDINDLVGFKPWNKKQKGQK